MTPIFKESLFYAQIIKQLLNKNFSYQSKKSKIQMHNITH